MYNIIKSQAGNRLVIKCKEKNKNFKITSHYADLNEFFKLHKKENLEYYQINGQNKIFC